MHDKPQSLLRNPLTYAFLISWIYWMYLLATTSMVIIFDGATLKYTAEIIYHHGLIMYFKTGPHNEPIYPALIAATMKLAEHTAFSYEKILAFAQILILFLSQILSLRLFRTMQLNKFIAACVILYMGISPALVNAAFSHWSEITALPFVLGIILLSCQALRLKDTSGHWKMFFAAVAFALVFSGLILIKAIFEFIFPIYFTAFILITIKSMLDKNYKSFRNMIIFMITALSLFYGFIYAYKSINQHFNGHFMMADRGPYIFYGNVVKRTDHSLSTRDWGASLATIPGDGICRKFFTKEECLYWGLQQVDYFGQGKMNQLRQMGIEGDQLDKTLMNLAREELLKHPLQYSILTALEGFKVFFWESTHVGYVSYPRLLTQAYDFAPFKNALRFTLALLSFIAFLYTLKYVLNHFHHLWRPLINEMPTVVPIFFMVMLIIPFSALYSLFFIHTRYCFPIAPLFLAMIGFWIQAVTKLK